MAIEFEGLVARYGSGHLLVFGPQAEALAEPLFGPPILIQPGYWSPPHNDFILPTAVIDDIGQRFPAPECYAWIEARGDAFPRADVIGQRPDGHAQTVLMKELDLAVMAAFASPATENGRRAARQVNHAIEARAVPDGYAVRPTVLPEPIAWLRRALMCHRLAPGVFGALGAAILNQLLANPGRELSLTFDALDDLLPAD